MQHASVYLSPKFWALLVKQGVALTGRNRTGPPCSVGRPTAQLARTPVALQATTPTTTACKTILAHNAGQ